MNESRKEFKWRTIKNHILVDYLTYLSGNYSDAYLRCLDMSEELREKALLAAIHYGKIIYKYGKTGILEEIQKNTNNCGGY